MLRAGVVHELRLLFVALQFLTRVPIPNWVGHEAAWLNRCVRYFPFVGAVVGGFGVIVMLVATRWWPPLVVGGLTVAATMWFTGAFHEDGLADTFDALGGVVPREKALSIMKDSRIGTYGAAALVVVLGLRMALVASLLQRSQLDAMLALTAACVTGRGGAVALMALLPYAGDAAHAKAKPLATAVPANSVWIAMALTVAMLAVAAAFGPRENLGRWAFAVAASMGVVVTMRRWLMRRLGGYTGDTLGATEQLIEVTMLLVLSAD